MTLFERTCWAFFQFPDLILAKNVWQPYSSLVGWRLKASSNIPITSLSKTRQITRGFEERCIPLLTPAKSTEDVRHGSQDGVISGLRCQYLVTQREGFFDLLLSDECKSLEGLGAKRV